MVWIWIPIIGILLGWLLWHGEQPEVREVKAKARRRKRAEKAKKAGKTKKKTRKPRAKTTTITIVDGVVMKIIPATDNERELKDLETLVLIDDFEEEVLDDV